MTKCAIYCDGSFTKDDDLDFKAGGIGIVFTNCHYSDISMTLEQLDDIRPTSQRADLWAIFKSLQLIQKHLRTRGDKKFTLYSTSSHAIQCIRKIVPHWAQKYGAHPKNWINSKGRPVVNRFLIDEASDLYIDINKSYSSKGWGNFEIIHFGGHSNNPNTERAGKLAENAAQRMFSNLLERDVDQSSYDEYYRYSEDSYSSDDENYSSDEDSFYSDEDSFYSDEDY